MFYTIKEYRKLLSALPLGAFCVTVQSIIDGSESETSLQAWLLRGIEEEYEKGISPFMTVWEDIYRALFLPIELLPLHLSHCAKSAEIIVRWRFNLGR